MRSFLTIMFVCLANFLFGAEIHLIPDGMYQDSTKLEYVAVTRGEIEFRIIATHAGEKRVWNKKYPYSLDSDGKIIVSASSNDSAFVFGIMKYDWVWDGKAIVSKNPKNAETRYFTITNK